MTTEHEASRTLVKSPPELWAECSVADSLARHLAGSFGEIRITTLEPETAVAWEGEHASGTVRLEPSGWGTRVTLTAQTAVVVEEEPAVPRAEAVEEEEPAVAPAEAVQPPVPAPEAVEPAVHAPEAVEPPVPAQAVEPPADPPPRRRFLDRLRVFLRGPEPVIQPEISEPAAPDASTEPPVAEVTAELVDPEPDPEPQPERVQPDPVQPDPPVDAEAVLTAALDSLGQAHHRPFSRA